MDKKLLLECEKTVGSTTFIVEVRQSPLGKIPAWKTLERIIANHKNPVELLDFLGLAPEPNP